MDRDEWDDIRRALIEFFRQIVPGRELIADELADIRDIGRFDPITWRALSGAIERLPEVHGLTIDPYEMDLVSTISEIEDLLRRSERRQMRFRRRHEAGDRSLRGDKFESWSAELSVNRSSSDAATEATDQAEYTVWYCTSRRPKDLSDSTKGYSSQRDSRIHYGSCTVYIPKSHKIGSIGSPWWKRILTLTDDRLKLLRIQEAEEDSFWSKISSHLDAIEVDERDALIYVHGYNVTFEDAALRAAQIGFDLSIKGAMAFFSWPSQGTLAGYPADEATIEANEGMISEFMLKFASQTHARAVHIIAHSMGNRGVLRAVNRIAQQATRKSGVPFGQIILAAADVDVDTFRNLCAAYIQLSKRATLYVSKRDLAVESSKWLHSFPRVGLIPPIFVTPGIDTINVTNVDLTALGHGYIASARDVLQDMHDLIVHGAPPGKRFGLREMKTKSGNPYWLIGR